MASRDNYWVRRLSSQGIGRRRFLGGAAAIGAGVSGLLAVGCGDDDDDTGGETPAGASPTGATGSPAAGSPTAATPHGKPGGVYRLSSSNATYDSFDASRSRFTPVGTIVGLTMQRIVQWDSFAEGKIGGGFAEKWEQPDGQTLVLKLRPNNFFHNKPPVGGRQTTAEDMKFHIERNKAGKLQDGSADPNFYRQGYYAAVDTVSVTDPSTVTVKFSSPQPLFLNLLAQPFEGIQAPEAVKQFEKD